MCRVTVEVDQDVLRDMRPDLDNMTAIRLWAQKLIDLHIQQMELEDDETMSIEEAREMTLAAVREEYAMVDACHAQNMHDLNVTEGTATSR